MPANPKYLTKSPWQQFAKISAGILGGYLITVLFHINLPLWLPAPREVLISGVYTIFLMWCAMLIVPFLFKNGWKAWLLYIILIVILSLTYYFGNQTNNPFV